MNTNSNYTIREAVRGDIPAILSLINDLAVYEKLEDQVVATEELLEEWIFDRRLCEVLLAQVDGVVVGQALFFYNFSTFLARPGIYLEDLFVKKEYRGRGYGKALLQAVIARAGERGCGRVEWSCLDWNKPSIDFYLSIGAVPMSDWTTFRLTGENLERNIRNIRNINKE